MATFIKSLKAMELLLDMTGEHHWRDWIRQDIASWESTRSAQNHLSAYGGMGSFNDVWLCRENGHLITEAQEPWVQCLFDILKGMCYQLAHDPQTDRPVTEILCRGSRYLPVIKAFNHDPTDVIGTLNVASRLEEATLQLQGTRCLHCGYAETTKYNLETFIAQRVLPLFILRTNGELSLEDIVRSSFAVDFPDLDTMRRQLTEAASSSGIVVQETRGWMRACAKCGSERIAVYRWELVEGKSASFRAAGDNLPLEGPRA